LGLRRPISTGFTLVELLVVLGIVMLLAALGVGALLTIPEGARVRGTEALIVKLDGRLNQQFGEMGNRDLSIQAITVDSELSRNDNSSPVHAQRAQLIAVIRTMRQSFPEYFLVDTTRTSDMINNDGDTFQDEQDEQVAGHWNPVDLNGGVPEQLGTELPGAAVAHLRYMEKTLGSPSLHTSATARAECLYMIVTRGGSEAAEFNPDEIADTDEDGLPEFVDKWGNPLQFFLWPTHFDSELQKPGEGLNPQDPNQLLTGQGASGDANAPAAAWWPNRATLFQNLYFSLTWNSAAKGFKTHPLIVSAGGDGGFGLITAGAGGDGVMGTLDDDWSDGKAERIKSQTINGYGADADNIDNHSVRSR